MSQGFKPVLDECDTKFGTYEDPPRTDVAAISLSLANGDTRHYDCVGTNVDSEETTLLAFDWVVFDEDAVRELASGSDIPMEEVEQEIAAGPDEPMLLLADVFPWREVARISVSGGVRQVLTPVREMMGGS